MSSFLTFTCGRSGSGRRLPPPSPPPLGLSTVSQQGSPFWLSPNTLHHAGLSASTADGGPGVVVVGIGVVPFVDVVGVVPFVVAGSLVVVVALMLLLFK